MKEPIYLFGATGPRNDPHYADGAKYYTFRYGYTFKRFPAVTRTIQVSPSEHIGLHYVRVSFPPHIFIFDIFENKYHNRLRRGKASLNALHKRQNKWCFVPHLFFEEEKDILSLPYLPNANLQGSICLGEECSGNLKSLKENFIEQAVEAFWGGVFNNEWSKAVSAYYYTWRDSTLVKDLPIKYHADAWCNFLGKKTIDNPEFWKGNLITSCTMKTYLERVRGAGESRGTWTVRE